MWKDVTSYSHGDTARIPRSWEATFGPAKVLVTRKHGLKGWFLDCHDVRIASRDLSTEDLEIAKSNALNSVRYKVATILLEIDKACAKTRA